MAKLNILYASEMCNAIDVADNTYLLASEKGLDAEQFEMNDVSMKVLQEMTKVLVVKSSTGDGDLPMMGEDFCDALSCSNINIEGIEYSVCALGYRSYFNFCGEAKRLMRGWRNWGLSAWLTGRIVTAKLLARINGRKKQLKTLVFWRCPKTCRLLLVFGLV
jgi:sulfite reductase (NADPH) flavoprotein alpha-component